MLLEKVQIPNSLSHKQGPNQLPRIMPLRAISGEDAITKEVFPFFVEELALAIICELSSQDGFHVLWIRGEEDTDIPHDGEIHSIGAIGSRSVVIEEPVPEFQAGI